MKRLFSLIMTIILITSMIGMTAFADGTVSSCTHNGNIVTASEDGHHNIEFSDSYHGFCINYGDKEAFKDQEFTVASMNNLINNNTKEDVSDYIKSLYIDYFEKFFTIDTETNTCTLNDKIAMQHYIWHFTDNFTGWRVDSNLVSDIKSKVDSCTEIIPDHGYIKMVNDTTQAVFDFHVLTSKDEGGYQNFFVYKITLIPYSLPEIIIPAEAQCIDVVANQSVNFSISANMAETYQWQVDKGDGFVNIEDAKDVSYTTPAADGENTKYRYRCIVSNLAGDTESPVFSLNYVKVPEFTDTVEDKKELEVSLGQKIEISVEVKGAKSYQWQVDKGDGKGFVDIEGATEAVLTIPSVTVENAGYQYRCIAGNLAGNTVSKVFFIKTQKEPEEIPDADIKEDVDKEPEEIPLPASKGTILKDTKSKGTYKVVSSSAKNAAVEFVKPTSKKATKITIPATIKNDGITYKVVKIKKNAFKNNTKLTKVTIGSNVTSIGTNAFYGCKKLKTVTIGKNVTIIGDKAFYKCISLKKITIPSKVTKIGKQAFYGCKKLKSITIKTTKLKTKKVGSKAFKGIVSKATVKVPKKKLSAYKTMLRKKGVSKKTKIKK